VTDSGFLVLADISGFTAFVASSELEHGAEVTADLLAIVMQRLAPPLEIQELEGDAVFAVGSDRLVPDGGALPGLLVDSFAAFKERQRQLVQENDCDCRACQGIPGLSLKLVAHHGSFVRQVVRERGRLAGPDVILVHRLLKNPLDADAYLLVTEPALQRIGVRAIRGPVRRHRLSYPHLGEVSCVVLDLEALDRVQDAAHPALAHAAPSAA
jgi:hypothetical protein